MREQTKEKRFLPVDKSFWAWKKREDKEWADQSTADIPPEMSWFLLSFIHGVIFAIFTIPLSTEHWFISLVIMIAIYVAIWIGIICLWYIEYTEYKEYRKTTNRS